MGKNQYKLLSYGLLFINSLLLMGAFLSANRIYFTLMCVLVMIIFFVGSIFFSIWKREFEKVDRKLSFWEVRLLKGVSENQNIERLRKTALFFTRWWLIEFFLGALCLSILARQR